MNELDQILMTFYERRSSRSAYRDYVQRTKDSRTYKWFHSKVILLVARGDLRQFTDGYERTKGAIDFWVALKWLGVWFFNDEDHYTKMYVRHVLGESNPEEFTKRFREDLTKIPLFDVANFAETMVQHPKLGLSYLEMYWQMQDRDGSTRAQMIQVVKENNGEGR